MFTKRTNTLMYYHQGDPVNSIASSYTLGFSTIIPSAFGNEDPKLSTPQASCALTGYANGLWCSVSSCKNDKPGQIKNEGKIWALYCSLRGGLSWIKTHHLPSKTLLNNCIGSNIFPSHKKYIS